MRSAFDGLSTVPVKRCNCETLRHDHAPGGCTRPAGDAKAIYVGALCDECAAKTPMMYLKPPHGTAR